MNFDWREATRGVQEIARSQADLFAATDAVLHRIRDALGEAGIDLPFPTRQVLFHDQTEESDGDRTRQREGWPAGNAAAPRPSRIADALRAMAGHGQEDR